MNHREEQESEVEALESIYPTEFTLIQLDPYVFRVFVKSERYQEGENGLCASLKFNIPTSYPDEIPEVEILVNEEDETEEEYETNLEPEHVSGLTAFLSDIANQNIGTPMIFTLVSECQEWLNKRFENELKEREDEEERRIYEAEEAERNRFEGTKVTVQNFMLWKTKFDAEMAAARQGILEKERELIGNKLTGRELFMRDTTLNESDLKFVEEGEVAIDEALFADDIDLDDDDDEGDDDD